MGGSKVEINRARRRLFTYPRCSTPIDPRICPSCPSRTLHLNRRLQAALVLVLCRVSPILPRTLNSSNSKCCNVKL